jgi:hypothetical protein
MYIKEYIKHGLLFSLLLAISFCYTNCNNYNIVFIQDEYLLTSPKTNWVYYHDEMILLSINIKANDIIWKSSINGYLGTGNHLYLYLEPGLHTITASIQGINNSVMVNVNYRSTDEIRNMVTGTPFIVKLRPGTYYPNIASFESGTLNDFNVSINANNAKLSDYSFYRTTNSIPLRDIRIEFNESIATENITRMRATSSATSSAISRAINSTTSNGSFFVESTLQNGTPPRLINFTLFHETDTYSLWADYNNTVNNSALNYLIAEVNNILLDVRRIWGDWADINNDGKITILVTNVINQENRACGFFNPYDFFPRNQDSASWNFNPYSNEMDVVYLGMPSEFLADPYLYNRIAATFAHELTHAITFSKKTWGKTDLWNLGDKREILSIDEGLSHLSECLIGYSISGDNSLFVNRFLEGTGHFSLFGRNADGFYDSVGMRGSMMLFLSWLFWKKGGFGWDSNGNIIDLGGIRFLRTLIESDGAGQDNIGLVFGEDIEHLFHRMIAEINAQRILGTKHNGILHPKTGEPVNLFTNMDYYNSITGYNEKIIIPISYNDADYARRNVVSWSFVFINPIVINQEEQVVLTSKNHTGKVFLNFRLR